MAISPSEVNCSFQYHDAQKLFERIDQLENRGEIIGSLREAYTNDPQGLKKESLFFHMCGRCLYGQMGKSSRLFQLSLAVQMVALGVFEAKALPVIGDNFDQISKDLETYSFNGLYEAIEKTPSKIQEKFRKVEQSQALLAAKNLRWLALALHHIDEYKNEKHAHRFTAIYELAESILNGINNGEAKGERDELLFNKAYFMPELEDPEDVFSACETLQSVDSLKKQDSLHIQEQQARSYDKEASALGDLILVERNLREKTNLLENQYKTISKAVKIANETEDFNPFLRFLFLHNSAKAALQCLENGISVLAIDGIRARLEIVLDAMEKSGYDHCDHVTFLTTLAQFEKFCGNEERVLERVKQALDLCENKFPESCQKQKVILNQLKKEIESRTEIALQHYQKAEKLFQNIEYLWPKDKLELFDHLEQAYERIYAFKEKRSELFYMAGCCLYNRRQPEQVRKSLALFALSFYAQLVSLNILRETRVPDIGLTQVSQCFDDNNVNELCTNLENSQLINSAQISSPELFLLAKTLFWLGRCLQNNSAHKQKTPPFEAIYTLVHNILTKVGTKNALWMRDAEVPFHTSTFLYGLKYPNGTVEEAFATLKKIEKAFEGEGNTVRAQEMKAQLHHQEATKFGHMASQADEGPKRRDLFQKRYDELCQAVTIANSTEGFDSFSRHQLITNKARGAMDCRKEGCFVADDNEIREELDLVAKFMKESDFGHHYFVSFLCTIIRFEVKCGNVERAREHLTCALNLCSEKFPKQCDKSHMDRLIKERDSVLKKSRYFDFLCSSILFDRWCGDKRKAENDLAATQQLFGSREGVKEAFDELQKKIDAPSVRPLERH